MNKWLEAKGNALAEKAGAVIQRFGVKRGISALFGGLMVVWVVAAAVVLYGGYRLIMAVL